MNFYGLPNKYQVLQDYYFEVKGLIISYNEALELFYQLDGSEKTDFEQYYEDEMGYEVIYPQGYEHNVIIDYDEDAANPKATGASHLKSANIGRTYDMLAYAKSHGFILDQKWAQFTYEEIIAMEQNGVNIPDEVLEIAHALQAENAVNEGNGTEGEEANDVREKEPFLDLIPKAKEKIKECDKQTEEISDEIAELLPEKEKKEKSLADRMEKQKNSLEEYESNLREWKSLKDKLDNGEVLTDREQQRYSKLSELLGAEKDEEEGMSLDKQTIAVSLEKINILSILGEDLAQETIQIGEDLVDYVSKENYNQTAKNIKFPSAIFEMVYVPMARNLGENAIDKGNETLVYTQQSWNDVNDIAEVLGVQANLSTVDEEGNIVDPEEPLEGSKDDDEKAEKTDEKSGFFFVTDEEVLGYIKEAQSINSELKKQIKIALGQIKVARNDKKYTVIATKKVTKIVEQFRQEEAVREQERQVRRQEIVKSQNKILSNNLEFEQMEQERIEMEQKNKEADEMSQKYGVDAPEDSSEDEEQQARLEEIEAREAEILEENKVEQGNINVKASEIAEINIESQKARESVRERTEVEKKNVDRRIPIENDALKVNTEYMTKDLPEHNERMDFINNAGANLMMIGAGVIGLGTRLIVAGHALLGSPFTISQGWWLIGIGIAHVVKGTLSVAIGAAACIVSDDESKIEEADKTTKLAGSEIAYALQGLSDLGQMITSVTDEVCPQAATEDASGTQNAEGSEGSQGGEDDENGEGGAAGAQGSAAGADGTAVGTEGAAAGDPTMTTMSIGGEPTAEPTAETETVNSLVKTNVTASLDDASAQPAEGETEDAAESIEDAEEVTGQDLQPEEGAAENAEETENPENKDDTTTTVNPEDLTMPQPERATEESSGSSSSSSEEEMSSDDAGGAAKEGESIAKDDSKDSENVKKDTEKDEKELLKETKTLQKMMKKDQKEVQKLTKESQKAAKKQQELFAEYEVINTESEQMMAEDEARQSAQNGVQDTSAGPQGPAAAGQAAGGATAMTSSGMAAPTGSDHTDQLNQNSQRINQLSGEFNAQGKIITRNSTKIKTIQKRTKTNQKKFTKKSKIREEKIKENEKKEQEKQKRLAKQMGIVGIANNVFTIIMSTGTLLMLIPFMQAVGQAMFTIGFYGTTYCALVKAAINIANGNWQAALMGLGQTAISIATSFVPGVGAATNTVLDVVSAGLSVVQSSAELVNNARAVQGKEASGLASKISAVAGAANVVTNAASGLEGGNTLQQIGKIGGIVGGALSSTSQLMTSFGDKNSKAAQLLGTIGGAISMASAVTSLVGAKMDQSAQQTADHANESASTESGSVEGEGGKTDGSKADGSKADGSKAEGSKAEGSKAESGNHEGEGGKGITNPTGNSSSAQNNNSGNTNNTAATNNPELKNMTPEQMNTAMAQKMESMQANFDQQRQQLAANEAVSTPSNTGNALGATNNNGNNNSTAGTNGELNMTPLQGESFGPGELNISGGIKGMDVSQAKGVQFSQPKQSFLDKAAPYMQIAGQALSVATGIMGLTQSNEQPAGQKKGSVSPYKWSKRMKSIRKKRITALQGRSGMSNNSNNKKRNSYG